MTMNRLPLRWRIPALYAAILLAVLAAAGMALYAQQERFLYDDLVSRLREQAAPIIDRRLAGGQSGRGSSGPPGAGNDSARQRAALIVLADDLAARDIGAAVYNIDATLIATTTRGLTLPVPPAATLARAARGVEGPFIQRGASDGVMWLLLPVRGAPGDPAIAIAQVGAALAPIDNALRTLALALALGIAAVLALTVALGVTATRRALRPLERVIAASGRIAAGNLSERVGIASADEIGQLGASFDAMVSRLEGSFAAQKRFVADAAHELRTPLTVLSGSIDLLRLGAAEGDPETTDRLLNNLDVELQRLIGLTNDLLTLSALDAQPRLALVPLDLSALLRDLTERYAPALVHHTFRAEIADGLRVKGVGDRLRQVVVNLLDNARKHTPDGKTIALRAWAEGGWVRVTVRDEGAGIPPEALPRIFDRFYRADDARTRSQGGTGLGLAICRAIADAHGGALSASSQPGAGSVFELTLPGG